jgi:hypothetical protein
MAARNSASCSKANPRINTAPGKTSSCVGSIASWANKLMRASYNKSEQKANLTLFQYKMSLKEDVDSNTR